MGVASDLKLALPGEFTTALTQVTAASQVTVDRDQPAPPVTAVAVWVRPPTTIEVTPGGLAEPEFRRPYFCRIEKAGGDDDDLEEFAQEVLRHFDGKKRPVSVTGLRHMLVEDLVTDVHPGEEAAVAMTFNLVAVSREPVTTA